VTTNLIKTTGRPMTAACLGMPVAVLPAVAALLGGSAGHASEGSGLHFATTGIDAIRVNGDLGLWTTMRDERPMSAPVAAVAASHGYGYAAGAGIPQKNNAQQNNPEQNKQQAQQYHAERAFRGPEPWRERT